MRRDALAWAARTCAADVPPAVRISVLPLRLRVVREADVSHYPPPPPIPPPDSDPGLPVRKGSMPVGWGWLVLGAIGSTTVALVVLIHADQINDLQDRAGNIEHAYCQRAVIRVVAENPEADGEAQLDACLEAFR